MLRQLIKEELSRLTEEPVSFVGASPGVHPPRGFSKNLESERDPPGYSQDHPAFSGKKVNAGELGFQDVFDGKPEKTESELRELGYTNEWDYEAYQDGFEEGIHEKGFKS
jgi:hypothetical protein